jgi:hypothetical protein
VNRYLHRLGMAPMLVLALSGTIFAQDKPVQDKPVQDKAEPSPPPNVAAMVPLKVQVVISRYQGDKKISSLPYMLSVNAQDKNDRREEISRLRMGARLPMQTFPLAEGRSGAPLSYQDFGTNIDCWATIVDASRFKIALTIDDSSLYTVEEIAQFAKNTGNPIVRQFRISNSAILKDGQSTQFTAAADRISGESVRVDVTVSVVK